MSNDNPIQTRRTVLQKGGLAAGGLALGTTLFTGSAAADRWDVEEDLTGEMLFNPCTGEVATFTSGTARMDFDVREDQSGGIHLSGKFVANGRLEGNDTGLIYEFSLSITQQEYVAADEMPRTVTLSGSVTVASRGSAENFRFRILARVTVAANGVTTVDWETESLDCVG